MNITQTIRNKSHTFLLSTDGNVYKDIQHIPIITNIIQIAYSRYHMLFLASDGTVYGIEDNIFKQLGLQDDIISTPTLISNLSKIIQVACGDCHSLFLTVYGCGYNEYKQLGIHKDNIFIPTLIPMEHSIVQISCDECYSLFTTSNNHVYGIGNMILLH